MKHIRNHLVLSLFNLVPLAGVFFAARICLAGNTVRGTVDSWGPSGLFCCYSTTWTNNQTYRQIHLFQYINGTIEPLFAKSVENFGFCPICLSTGVVDVTAYGEIRKFDLKGDVVFQKKLEGFAGACGMSGKLNDEYIFMTETLFDGRNKGPLYKLYLVDISGKEPVAAAKFKIAQPLRVVRTSEEIIVIAKKQTLRFKIPTFIKLPENGD